MFCWRNERCGWRFRRRGRKRWQASRGDASFRRVGAFRVDLHQGSKTMGDFSTIREHMEVIGADGVHVGTVDKVEGERIKLTKADAGQGSHEGHHHFIARGLVADVEGDRVRLSANADVALSFAEEEGGDAL